MFSELCYDTSWISVHFPMMQMLPKYHQLSCVNHGAKKENVFFFLYHKRMIYWYLSSISWWDFSFMCYYGNFPFCYELLSMYLGMMYNDCCSVTSDFSSPTGFFDSLMNDCLLKSQHSPPPKKKKCIQVYEVAWLQTSEASLKEACCFSWIMMTCFWFEYYNAELICE